MKIELKGINKVKRKLASGDYSVHHYHRGTGRKLSGEPGSPEFLQSWHDAQDAVVRNNRHANLLQEIINDYKAASAFRELRETTRDDYRRQLKKIEREFGDLPTVALSDPEIRAEFLNWRDRLGKRSPRQADAAIVMLGTLIAWGLDQGKYGIKANYAVRPGRLYRADRSEMIWLPEHFEALDQVVTEPLRRAVALATETGQRKGDLLRLPWSAYDGRYIRLKQSKRGKRVAIRATGTLRSILDGLERTADTILTSARGHPWNPAHDFTSFNDRWRAVMKRAGLGDSGLHFNDLRGTFITDMFESGATVAEAAAISGHSLVSAQAILDAYLARTGVLADQAMDKLERYRAARGR